MPSDVVERALADENSELTLILAKVAGFSPRSTRAVLGLRPERSSQDMDQALDSYDRLPADTARRVLDFFRDRAKGPIGSGRDPSITASG
jgi:hypothetical protein